MIEWEQLISSAKTDEELAEVWFLINSYSGSSQQQKPGNTKQLKDKSVDKKSSLLNEEGKFHQPFSRKNSGTTIKNKGKGGSRAGSGRKHSGRTAASLSADYARQRKASERDLKLPECENPERRLKYESGKALDWCRFYFPDTFFLPISTVQYELSEAMMMAIMYGHDEARAAPRSEGKTTVLEGTVLFAMIKGLCRFALLFAQAGPKAIELLSDIKKFITDENNDLFIEDYPELYLTCVDVDSSPNRCKGQTVNGRRTHIKWSIDEISLPVVKSSYPQEFIYEYGIKVDRFGRALTGTMLNGKDYVLTKQNKTYITKSTNLSSIDGRFIRLNNQGYAVYSQAKIKTYGLDSKSIRGTKVGNRRPDFAGIDDPETEDSAKSDVQIEHRINLIEGAIGGAGSQQKRISRFISTTIQNSKCLSAQYTDPQQNPSWTPKRYSFLSHLPDPKSNQHKLWIQYIEKRKNDQRDGDKHSRNANKFYLDNQKEMDGTIVPGNPHRYNNEEITTVIDRQADKSNSKPTLEENTAIQHFINIVADRGWRYAKTEYQNDPPIEEEPEESGIEPFIVRASLNGYPQTYCPYDTKYLTSFTDLGKRRLHTVVISWNEKHEARIVDYFITSTNFEDNKDIKTCIKDALYEIRAKFMDESYYVSSIHYKYSSPNNGDMLDNDDVSHSITGKDSNDTSENSKGILDEVLKPIFPSMNVVDAGNWNDVTIPFVNEQDHTWVASYGSPKYVMPPKSTNDKKLVKTGRALHRAKQPKFRTWTISFDPDFYKNEVHNGFLRYYYRAIQGVISTENIVEPEIDEETGKQLVDEYGELVFTTVTKVVNKSRAYELSIFGNEPFEHTEFADEVTAQIWTEEWVEKKIGGLELKKGFNHIRPNDHFLDCLAGNLVAYDYVQSYKHITVTRKNPPPQASDTKKTILSLSEEQPKIRI